MRRDSAILAFAAFLGLSLNSGPGIAQAGPTVLFVGDSHTVGSFGRQLDALLRTLDGSRVHTVGSCGSQPGWFYTGQSTSCGFFSRDPQGRVIDTRNHPTPLFPDLMSRARPEIVIIALSGNYISGYSEAYIRTTLRRMVTDIAAQGPICLWAGSPTMRKRPPQEYDWLYRLMNEELGHVCTHIDSRKVTWYPSQGGDGVHFDGLGALGRQITGAWAQAVFDVLKKRIQGESLDPEVDPLYVR